MKNQLFSKNGFSLVAAIVTLAIMTGITSYLMSLRKNDTVASATSRRTTLLEVERKRIIAALSNSEVCKLAENFGGQSPVRAAIPLIASGPAVTPPSAVVIPITERTLIATNTAYYDNIFTITDISTRSTSPNDNGYFLDITYKNTNVNNTSYTGINRKSVLSIPMYMRIAAGVVQDCYAIAESNKVNLAINAACSPALLAQNSVNNNSLLQRYELGTEYTASTDTQLESSCTHSMTFDQPLTNSTECLFTTGAPSKTTLLTGFNMNTTTHELNFPISKCSSINTTCTDSFAGMYKIIDSTAVCSQPGDARDGTCTAGQVVRVNGATATCVSTSCSAPGSFIHSLDSAGLGCFTAPPTTCAANQYIKKFNPTGPDTCDNLPAMNGNCGAGFGTSVTRAYTTNDGVLNCASYTKTKSCATPSNTTFAQNFNSSTSAGCATF